ncbi:MAG: UPF0280 family protein [Pirellulaceae bacterium]|nr:UPF0280 family protein [Pirellulaceae bacterium]
MIRHNVHIGETIATILTDERFIPVAEAEIRRQRRLIEDYIEADPEFLATTNPHQPRAGAPEIVRRMCGAAAAADVGPMAAVAGAIAEFALKAMARAGATHAVVDNGGDLALLLSHSLTVGIFAGDAKIRDIGFRFPPRPGIFGVCASSGTVGHSLSFGRAEAAVAVAENVCLADAVATALGNAIQTPDEEHIKEAMQRLLIPGVEGLLVVIDDMLGACGDLPDIVNVRLAVEKISGVSVQP